MFFSLRVSLNVYLHIRVCIQWHCAAASFLPSWLEHESVDRRAKLSVEEFVQQVRHLARIFAWLHLLRLFCHRLFSAILAECVCGLSLFGVSVNGTTCMCVCMCVVCCVFSVSVYVYIYICVCVLTGACLEAVWGIGREELREIKDK